MKRTSILFMFMLFVFGLKAQVYTNGATVYETKVSSVINEETTATGLSSFSSAYYTTASRDYSVAMSATSLEQSKGESIIWGGDSLFSVLTKGMMINDEGPLVYGNIIDNSKSTGRRGMIVDFRDFSNINYYLHPVISGDTNSYYFHTSLLNNSNYLCLGLKMYDNTNNNGEIFITILDSNLNFVSEKSYQIPLQYSIAYYFKAFQESSDTILYAFSVKEPNILSDDLGLMRVNALGDTLETKYYELDNTCHVYDIAKVPNENKYAVSVLVGSTDYRTIILNQDLSIESMFTYDDPEEIEVLDGNRDFGYWKADNTYLTAGEGFFPSKGDKTLYVANCDLEGNLLDYVFLNTEVQDQSAFYKPLVGANDTTIYVLGHDMCMGCNEVTDFAKIEVFTLDVNLNVLGYNVIDSSGYQKSRFVLTNSDGDLIIGALRNVGETYNFNSYIIRIPREELGLAVSVRDLTNPEEGIKVYPNPARDKIHFQLSHGDLIKGVHIEFHTLTGKTALSRPMQGQGNTIEVDISNLPSGTYIYEITNQNRSLSKGQFIKN